jgi:hypothetical protein
LQRLRTWRAIIETDKGHWETEGVAILSEEFEVWAWEDISWLEKQEFLDIVNGYWQKIIRTDYWYRNWEIEFRYF